MKTQLVAVYIYIYRLINLASPLDRNITLNQLPYKNLVMFCIYVIPLRVVDLLYLKLQPSGITSLSHSGITSRSHTVTTSLPHSVPFYLFLHSVPPSKLTLKLL